MAPAYNLFQNPAQEIVGGRLHYHIGGQDFEHLKRLARINPALEQAIDESYPTGLESDPSYLVPVDLLEMAWRGILN